MKKATLLFTAIILMASVFVSYAKDKSYTLKSPDGSVEVVVRISDNITYSVLKGGNTVIAPSLISMTLEGGKVFGLNSTVRNAKVTTVSGTVESPFYRCASIHEEYNQLEIKFKEGFGLQFRAYPEGVSYRFCTYLKDSLTIISEEANFNFEKDYSSFIPYSDRETNPFQTSFESTYTISPISEFIKGKFSILPLLVSADQGMKVAITESDLESYPGMFLTTEGASSKYGYHGAFAGIPSKVEVNPYRCQEIALERSSILAKTVGTRTFPWRVIAITEKDTELPTNNMVYLLGSPNRIGDVSWIKPGKVAWDWWNDWGISGVDFKVGINTATYKYFIDFAAANGLEYIVLDEGWSKPSGGDIMSVIPELDLKELVEYGKSKNVGVILWAVAFTLDQKLEEACKHYSEMGIKGFKIDFLDRDDQPVVDLIYRILDVTAKYHLMVDYHGMYKPTGLNRTYPNLVNYEGVFGLEQMKWNKDDDHITYNVTFPYIRMMAGPVDYTQGAMRNAGPMINYAPFYSNPMSQGTRAHQVAAYVVFDSPLVMLADSPSAYMKEQETTDFISGIPTVWDETKVLEGNVGQYIITARRKGNDWFIGGMNGWTPRDITLDLSFITAGKHPVSIYKDGINAEKVGIDYKLEHTTLDTTAPITIHMAPGGGFAMQIR